MDVQAQFLYSYLDKSGSMFDFSLYFFIVNPVNSAQQASYTFEKSSTAKENKEIAKIDKLKGKDLEKRTSAILGSYDTIANENKPYNFNTLTEKSIGKWVDAVFELDSYNSSTFTLLIYLKKKRSRSVVMRFDGEKPSWMLDNGKFHLPGALMMTEIMDFNAKKKP